MNQRLTKESVIQMLEEGLFTGSNNECIWILSEKGQEVGFIRIFDLDDIEDGCPLFDLRIKSEYRGRGLGKLAVRWLTKYLFEKYPQLERIVGTTRSDNHFMRKTFLACGYVKEGHYRKDWPSALGEKFDTVKYGILREDWVSNSVTPVPWNDERGFLKKLTELREERLALSKD